MKAWAENIFDIIGDYHNDHQDCKYPMSTAHILRWGSQFGDDAAFVLEELAHILPKVYLSKVKAKDLLLNAIHEFKDFYKYGSIEEFLKSTSFLEMQLETKSQREILGMVDELLVEKFGFRINDFNGFPKKNFIYFDDTLATGGTLYRDFSRWLSLETENGKNIELVLSRSINLASSFFCIHQLGLGNVKWRLMKNFDDKLENLIITRFDYLVENQVKWSDQKLNCLYPVENQSKYVLEYLNSLPIPDIGKTPPFRRPNQPTKELFFTNAQNRLKFERIFLEKGIELLGKVKSLSPDPRKRPLGDTVKSHRTFGTGTLYFVWRNISNTCPLVFWWDVPGHDWIPLFCVKNRGLSY